MSLSALVMMELFICSRVRRATIVLVHGGNDRRLVTTNLFCLLDRAAFIAPISSSVRVTSSGGGGAGTFLLRERE